MTEYAIHGGGEGSDRLDILGRTIEDSTREFLQKADIAPAMTCLDLGCGIGKVSMMLAQMTGDQGKVLGVDIDELNIQKATQTAQALGIANVNFSVSDAYEFESDRKYDLIYSRFLLSHLSNPGLVLEKALTWLNPGGKLLIEETDFSGHFCHPQSDDFDRYVSLYQDLLTKRGANANLGQGLPVLLSNAGFTNVAFQISQPAHKSGEGKLMAEITFKGISQALMDEGLLSESEFVEIRSGLIQHRQREDSIVSLPRIFQITAHAPG